MPRSSSLQQLLLGALALSSAAAQQALPSATPAPTVTAGGHAVVELAPSTVRISYTTTTTATTAALALSLNGAASDATIQALGAVDGVGPDAFAFTSFQLQQVFNSTSNGFVSASVLVGYSAVRGARVTLFNLSLVAPVVTAIVNAPSGSAPLDPSAAPSGPNTLDAITYDVSDDERLFAYQEALATATSHAEAAAAAIADAASMELAAPLALAEQSSGASPVSARAFSFAPMAASGGAGSEAGFASGPIKVAADVSATWAMVPFPSRASSSVPPAPSGAPTLPSGARRALGGLRVGRV